MQKQLLYKGIADKMEAKAHIPPNEVIIVLTEIEGKENWSFGNGVIQNPLHI